jgi:hypothetical protein
MMRIVERQGSGGRIACFRASLWMALIALLLPVQMASAQVRTVDPNTAIDADLAPGAPASDQAPIPSAAPTPAAVEPVPPMDSTATATTTTSTTAGQTYKKDDVIGAAEGVFGKGAEGLGAMIEKILKDQGEPIAYITGREAAAAIGVGLRYGSGTMNHKTEGPRPVYWTGPSIGFDLGGNAGKTFVLVYNLYDSQNLYKRYPAGEGAAYIIGGFTASYLRRGDVVLIPIRLGVGWRLGVNAGYMKFSEKRQILPF